MNRKTSHLGTVTLNGILRLLNGPFIQSFKKLNLKHQPKYNLVINFKKESQIWNWSLNTKITDCLDCMYFFQKYCGLMFMVITFQILNMLEYSDDDSLCFSFWCSYIWNKMEVVTFFIVSWIIFSYLSSFKRVKKMKTYIVFLKKNYFLLKRLFFPFCIWILLGL